MLLTARRGVRSSVGRTWGRRSTTPVVKVTGSGNRRMSLAALIAVKPGHRPRLIYRVHVSAGAVPACARGGERNTRAIPQDVKIEVEARGGGRCRQCGSRPRFRQV